MRIFSARPALPGASSLSSRNSNVSTHMFCIIFHRPPPPHGRHQLSSKNEQERERAPASLREISKNKRKREKQQMKRHLHRVRVFFACQTCAKKRTKSTIPSDKGGVAQIDRGRLCADSVSPPHLYQATTLVIDEALNGATHADHILREIRRLR